MFGTGFAQGIDGIIELSVWQSVSGQGERQRSVRLKRERLYAWVLRG
jgi:hypothetical protein